MSKSTDPALVKLLVPAGAVPLDTTLLAEPMYPPRIIGMTAICLGLATAVRRLTAAFLSNAV